MFLSTNSLYLALGNSSILYTYFFLILLFLIPFSFLVSVQLFQLIKFELYFYDLNQIDSDDYSMDQLFYLLKILLKKKLWLTSINLMESKKNIFNENIHKYFNSIGYLYDSMDKHNLAILYYLKALSFQDKYIVALQNLAKVYEKKKNYPLALSTYKSILKYDESNLLANEYLEKRN